MWFEIDKDYFILSDIPEKAPKFTCLNMINIDRVLENGYWEASIRKYEYCPRPYDVRITLYPPEEKQIDGASGAILIIVAKFADLNDAFIWVEKEIETQENCLDKLMKENISL